MSEEQTVMSHFRLKIRGLEVASGSDNSTEAVIAYAKAPVELHSRSITGTLRFILDLAISHHLESGSSGIIRSRISALQRNNT